MEQASVLSVAFYRVVDSRLRGNDGEGCGDDGWMRCSDGFVVGFT